MQSKSDRAKTDPSARLAEDRRPRRRRANLLPYALIGPIALLLLAISVYPSLYAIWLAMTDASLLRLARAQFIGIDNFVRLAGDSIFLDSLWRTVRWDVAVVLSELLIALPIALFLNLTFRGRGFVRVAMMIPYITPPAVVALLFAYMFDGNFGAINDLLVKVGLLDRYVSWLSDPAGSFAVTVAAMVWYGQPLMALILLAALQTIPQALYDAANVDGASAWQRFRYITLPHLMPSILFLVLLRLIWMSNHIDMIFVLTQGGPGFANYTAAVYSFKLTNQFEIGYASAVAVVLTILLVAASAMYVRHLARKVLVSA
jgi:multiple sugar transport system permease protein